MRASQRNRRDRISRSNRFLVLLRVSPKDVEKLDRAPVAQLDRALVSGTNPSQWNQEFTSGPSLNKGLTDRVGAIWAQPDHSLVG